MPTDGEVMMDGGRSTRAKARSRWWLSCSTLILCLVPVTASEAQDAPASPEQPAQPTPTPSPESKAERDQIVVIGNRAIIASLQDLEPEQVYDEDAADSYGVSTLGEMLDEIRSENGDDQAAYLVNGVPVQDVGDVADLPVEAIQRVEALPRGAAQRVGGAAGQRAYNIVLKPSLNIATLTASREMATEGGWANNRGEAIFTSIKDQDRINVTLRGAQSGTLFESERDFIPLVETTPFSALGNIVPSSGNQIDPALDLLVGKPVSVLALAGPITGKPTLSSLAGGAGQTNPSNLSSYRSLRGSSRPLEFAIAGNKQINEWLSLSFNGRMNLSRSVNYSGLPSGRFTIPASNPFTPFGTTVALALNDPSRPLRSVSESTTGSLSSTLNAVVGRWHGSLDASYDLRDRNSVSSTSGSLGALATVTPGRNPFDGSLASLIPVIDRPSESSFSSYSLKAQAEGPLFDLWAGPVFGRIAAGGTWLSLKGFDPSGERRLQRHEYTSSAGVTIPLTGGEREFLPALGESELALDIGVTDLGKYGKLDSYSVALNLQPTKWLRVVASQSRDEHAIVPELLAAPTVVIPNYPYFDPLTGQSVDVTSISGGTPGLLPESLRTRAISVTLTPYQKYNLRLTADYEVNDLDNQIGTLPPPSTAVVAAFPDRFVRDASGTLVLVDSSAVNFARQHTEQLRLGTNFMIPLIAGGIAPAAPGTPARDRKRIPPLRLQVSASQTIVLESTSVIRTGLPVVDLLDGGAIGLGGSRPRNSTDLSLALTRGGSGARLTARRRGESYVVTGTTAAPDLLTFEGFTTVDLKLFTDLGELFPSERALKKTRVTLAFDNLNNDRQRVTNLSGATPQAYQPVRRDAVGRTVMIELRKVF
ncbi:TonB-dependent receptor [Tsuneonella rigui]|uniref:TonB-dependent receptor n=1 Tax=Tsuneonella rigui TaxID=1708790 RepID=UPI000F7F87F0|nr:TonB-dependent receptor [Tsuneonella rigui]